MALTGNRLATTVGGTTYTVNNTDGQTNYLYTENLSANSGNNTFQVNVTRNTGTLAGSATLEGSLDGTNWVATVESAVNLTNAATNTLAIITTKRYLFYRIACTTTGTVTATFSAYQLEDKIV